MCSTRLLLDLRRLACFCGREVASSATLAARQWSIRRGITDAAMSSFPLPEITHLKGHSLSSIYQTVAGNSKTARGSGQRPEPSHKTFLYDFVGQGGGPFVTTE